MVAARDHNGRSSMPSPRPYENINPRIGDIVFRSPTDRRFFRVAEVWQAGHGYVGYAGISDAEGREFTVCHWREGDKLLVQEAATKALPPGGVRAKLAAVLSSRGRQRAWILARVNHLIYASDGSWTGQHEMSGYERRIKGIPKDTPPIIVDRRS